MSTSVSEDFSEDSPPKIQQTKSVSVALLTVTARNPYHKPPTLTPVFYAETFAKMEQWVNGTSNSLDDGNELPPPPCLLQWR